MSTNSHDPVDKSEDAAGNGILTYGYANPLMVAGIVGVIIILFVALYFGLFRGTGAKETASSGKGKKGAGAKEKCASKEESEIDDLIDAIHDKQNNAE